MQYKQGTLLLLYNIILLLFHYCVRDNIETITESTLQKIKTDLIIFRLSQKYMNFVI